MPARPENFGSWLEALGDNASVRCGRYLLVLSGSRQWSLGLCQAMPVLGTNDTLWVTSANEVHPWQIAPAAALSLLGSETANIVYDAWSGLHPNSFGALAGTVRAGGLMVLLVPALDGWSQYQDPDYQRMSSEGPGRQPTHHFLQHLAQTLQRDTGTLVVREGEPLPPLPHAVPASPRHVTDPSCRSDDQWRAVMAIEHVVRGHRDRPLVLRSDRGRGKSAALGIAAARLLQAELETIILTAPLASNVAAVFRHAAALLEGSQQHGNTLHWRDCRLQYVPPDELLRTTPPARLLLVDEAAGIPVPLLSQMLDHYHRVVFTTTVHGYEGTGQGFAIRFSRELDQRKPHWRTLVLQQAIRWAENDPLEKTVSDMLFLGAEPAPASHLSALALEQASIEWMDRGQLLQFPGIMSQLVGLLVTAHYRTTPDDIRVLLDAPNILLLLARQGDTVLGAVMLACEGELPAELAASICRGQRRPRGHLLPQALWAHSGCVDLLTQKTWRVVRIAVHSGLRRRGLGHRMLQRLQQLAVEQGVNYLGSSFACSSDLLDFWCDANYSPVALGVRRDASSGSHALLVLQGLGEGEQKQVEEERRRFVETFAAALSSTLQRLEPDIVALMLLALAPSQYPLQPRDKVDLEDFVTGARTYEHCQLALWKATLHRLSDAGLSGGLSEQQRAVLIARVLQQQPVAAVAQRYQLQGKAALLDCLRTGLGRGLERFS